DPDDVDEEGPQNHAPIIAGAAHDHHDPDHEGVIDRLVAGGIENLGEGGQDRAADAHQDRAEDEELQLAAGDVLAHGGGGDVVVADGAHHAAPGTTIGALHQNEGDDQDEDGDAQEHQARIHEAVGDRHASRLQVLGQRRRPGHGRH